MSKSKQSQAHPVTLTEKKKQQPELKSFYSCINTLWMHTIIFPLVLSSFQANQSQILWNSERATVWEMNDI